MRSNRDYLIWIGYGLKICVDTKKKSQAWANKNYFGIPKNVGVLKAVGNWLYFAGGQNENFGVVDIQVWGLN